MEENECEDKNRRIFMFSVFKILCFIEHEGLSARIFILE